ncbi:MAG TPA: response regulator transcription factor [Gaiellaceae bacterium]|jgi:NarL family two-component system response regulator LiaR|nr:response regulator transcription factor [Gaiellaceae bacterium]
MPKQALPVRVLLVDDQPMFVEALRALLETDERVDVVATADNGIDAIDLATTALPDVVLVDLTLPGLDGVETTRRLVEDLPGMRVVVLSGRAEDAGAALEAGASRFLAKGGLHGEIADAIVAAHLAA